MSMKDREKLIGELREAIVGFDVEAAKDAAQRALDEGVAAERVIDVMSESMSIVGDRYEAGDYFVTELIIAGEVMKEVIEVLEPHMRGEAGGGLGTVVVATVEGDIHDIGKNVLVTLLTTAGFRVVDLGVDVPADRIVEAVRKSRADILGLSALLTTNLEQFPLVVERLRREGLRDGVRVIVGGATVTEEFAREAGVDAYAKTALEGVEICKGWAKEFKD